MVLPLLAALCLLQTPPKYELKAFQFVMFKKGKEAAMSQQDSSKALMAHLSRLEDLWLKQGKAVLLGPMADNGDLRGIVVMDATPEDARAFVDEDPFVKAGAMTAEIRTLFAADKILQKPPKFMDLTDYTLGFYKRPDGEIKKLGDEEATKMQAAHLANNVKMRDAGLLVWAGPFKDSPVLRGLLVFRSTDRAAIEEMIKEDPFVKAGNLTYELHPAKTAKGVFPEK